MRAKEQEQRKGGAGGRIARAMRAVHERCTRRLAKPFTLDAHLGLVPLPLLLRPCALQRPHHHLRHVAQHADLRGMLAF